MGGDGSSSTGMPVHGASGEFARIWRAAFAHIKRCDAEVRPVWERADTAPLAWMRAHSAPPYLEHLSFYLGNQLFFIRIEDEDGAVPTPGSREMLLRIASGCAGRACVMPMRRTAGEWRTILTGWGLFDIASRCAVCPPSVVTDEEIEVTDWELLDHAVQIVREDLAREGRDILSWQTDPDVDPSLWFEGDNGPEWVMVRAVRAPSYRAELPERWRETARHCTKVSKFGNFASVAFSADADHTDGRILRARKVSCRYMGLERLLPFDDAAINDEKA